MSSTGCPRIGRARRRGATVELRRNFFTEVHQHRGTSPPFPEQELLDCVSDGDGEPLDSLEERCNVNNKLCLKICGALRLFSDSNKISTWGSKKLFEKLHAQRLAWR